jgi:conjugal transfer pilus assembly protein TraA
MVHSQPQPFSQLAAGVDQFSTRATLWLMENKRALLVGMVVFALLLVALDVTAGTTATEFQGIYTKLKDWTSGYLGKAIALFAFLLGLGVGVAKSSPIPAISGVVFALFVAFGPAVLEGIATATL